MGALPVGYTRGVWEIEGTDQFAEWYRGRSDEEQEAINEAVVKLEEHGPSLAAPWRIRCPTYGCRI